MAPVDDDAVPLDGETARAVARARESFPSDPSPRRVVFGVDGYVDRVREVVADRADPESYDRLETLAALDERVAHSVAQGSSLTLEWLQTGTRTGGHAPHLSRIFGEWGFDPVMIGTFGDPELDVFATEFADCERHSLGEPGYTDAVEFADGKLMLCEMGATTTIDWSTIESCVGRETLADRLDGAALLGLGYWSDAPDLPDVLDGLSTVWDRLDRPPGHVLLDPGDVRKLDADRLRSGREAIRALGAKTAITLSANRAETRRLAAVFDEATDDPRRNARVAFDAFAPDLFVSHGVDRSIAVTDDGVVGVAVPRVDEPVLTTSAGDHFNAGLALARLEGLDPGQALVVGNAVAREFVRTGTAPSLADVRDLLGTYETVR